MAMRARERQGEGDRMGVREGEENSKKNFSTIYHVQNSCKTSIHIRLNYDYKNVSINSSIRTPLKN